MTGETQERETSLALADNAGTRLMDTYSPADVTFVRGEGSWLFDKDGRRYLDLLCGIAVTSLGHCNPAVVAALSGQAQELWHVSNLFRNDIGPLLAASVDELVSGAIARVNAFRKDGYGPDENAGSASGTSVGAFEKSAGAVQGKVFLANSGAESNECAIKLARKYSGKRRLIVTLKGSFHGRTIATLAATGQASKHEPFLPLPPDFDYVTVDGIDVGSAIAHLERIMNSGEVAAVMLETIRGEGEVREVPREFIAAARRMCNESGSLLIVDEIQTGLGRTGKWFGFEHVGVEPDIVTMAKALGNGMPIGCCWARDEVAAAFQPGDHGSTFGGQPLACSAAIATLEELKRIDAPAKAMAAGDRFRASISEFAKVAQLRGSGLLIGIGLHESFSASDAAESALEKGVVVNAIGQSTIRIAPPVNISDDEIDFGIGVLGEILGGTADGSAHT